MAPQPIDLVFVHGLFSSPKVWTSFEALIAEDPDLSGLVTVHCFMYDSPFMQLRPDRRIPEMDDIADRLRTYLSADLRNAESIVLASHSQGGLVVQRFLARTLANGRGRDLARIKHVVMYACPNTGAQFLLSLRRSAFFWRNPQEKQLRPFDRAVTETQRAVLQGIVNAQSCTDTECRIPIAVYSGMSDKIVPPVVAASMFPTNGMLDGDHFSIVQPSGRTSSSYLVLKDALIAAGQEDAKPGATGDALAEQRVPVPESPPSTAGEAPTERLVRVSVSPPFGRRDGTLYGRSGLISSITVGGEPRVHILAGLGGSGKSRIALEIAHRAQQAGRRVWWVEVTRINSGMREVASQLDAPESRVELAWKGSGSPTDLVWRFLNDCPEPWLLIFDNADDPQALGPGPANGSVSDGTGWLRSPANPNGMVLVTSRDRNEATWGSWTRVHDVLPLGADDGAAILMELAGGVGGTNEQARLLSTELGGLPLALRAAASYVKSTASVRVWSGEPGIRDFDGYREAVKRRFESPAGEDNRALSELMGEEIVEEVYGLSLKLLADRGLPQAALLLKLFACLNITPLPYHVLLKSEVLAGSPLFPEFAPSLTLTLLEGLADLSLVDLSDLDEIDDPSLSHVALLHPLVHGILRADHDVQRRRTEYYGLNVRLLLAATDGANPDDPEDWPLWNIIAPHAVEVSRASTVGAPPLADRGVIASALELARLTVRYLLATGLVKPARDLVLPIIDNCRMLGFDENDREILGLRHEKARIELESGDPVAAEAELRQVIAGRRRVLGEKHPDTLASGHKLGKAMLEQGRWAEAETELRPIVEAEKDVRGWEHSDTTVVRHSLARAVLAQGRYGEAERMFREIIEVRTRKWPPTSPETLFARQSLARSLLEQGKVDAAEAEVSAALEVAEGADRPDERRTLYLRQTLILVRLMQGRAQEAGNTLSWLLEEWRRVLGPNHPQIERTSDLLVETQRLLSAPADPGTLPATAPITASGDQGR